MKSLPRMVTDTPYAFAPSERIRAATLSARARSILYACSAVTTSSSVVVDMLYPFASSASVSTEDSSLPLAYSHTCLPIFCPSSACMLKRLAFASAPIVVIPACSSFLAVAGPTVKSSPTRSGHSFSRISPSNRVWTLSGFSKSLAIFASSLLLATPIFTVKPRLSRISSFILRASSTGSP